jgi:hypothetical protein
MILYIIRDIYVYYRLIAVVYMYELSTQCSLNKLTSLETRGIYDSTGIDNVVSSLEVWGKKCNYKLIQTLC